MPTTRKKIVNTVHKNYNSSGDETANDFTDSGSEAEISDQSSESDSEYHDSDDVKFTKSKKRTKTNKKLPKRTKFAKSFINKIRHTMKTASDDEDSVTPLFSVKDLTEADKLLPPILNLSESDSDSDNEQPKHVRNSPCASSSKMEEIATNDSDQEIATEYRDVFADNFKDTGDEIAKQTFEQLQQHANKLEETRTTLEKYTVKNKEENLTDVNHLLALGEEVQKLNKTEEVLKKLSSDDNESDIEDWEEVKDSKPIQDIQLVVDFHDAATKKTKAFDIEMMMKRKINRVRKEYQVYMHKVHVLCWLGHGNYVSRILNDQDMLTAALSLVPSQNCYPGERVDIKYVQQITKWYNDKIILKLDKNENKFKPKAPSLKEILLKQIKTCNVTTNKFLVFIFVSLLRSLGLQCRVVFNFVTLPLKPPSSELCSLSTKNVIDTNKASSQAENSKSAPKKTNRKRNMKPENKGKQKSIPQMDGTTDTTLFSDSDFENIMQLDGNDDNKTKRLTRSKVKLTTEIESDTNVSPPKRARTKKNDTIRNEKKICQRGHESPESHLKISCHFSKREKRLENIGDIVENNIKQNKFKCETSQNSLSIKKSQQSTTELTTKKDLSTHKNKTINKEKPPKILVTDDHGESSKYFSISSTSTNNEDDKPLGKRLRLSRKRSHTTSPKTNKNTNKCLPLPESKCNVRTRSAPNKSDETCKYFTTMKVINTNKDMDVKTSTKKKLVSKNRQRKSETIDSEESMRVSHRDIKTKLAKTVKDKQKEHCNPKSTRRKSESDNDFQPTKVKPNSVTRKGIDHRIASSDEDSVKKQKVDVWCEVFVEELEQWVSVDVVKGQVHVTNEIYGRSTHPVAYIVGWDNNNNLKDLTCRYVPHWNTVTRKQRVEPCWWNTAIQPWCGPKTSRDREEDEYLDKLQLEAPLPKSIAEFKNHPLYALKRHLLKFEAIYPPNPPTLGFIRGEPIYARQCVHVCRSRDTWLKEAKVVRLGEKPYKIVKARPKWDKLSNKVITDQLLEVFGPWQIQDYEPPVAENGIVPRNAYGNVELFKDCMLPKGTVHIKLPGLNKVARKLNIDCAPAMTGFDFNGGFTHPVFDGFVVCKEFEEIMTDAWVKDQEEQERKEREKIESRVYGNWRKLIKGLFIRERLKDKYGFEKPSTVCTNKKKSKGPKFIVKKNY